MKRGEEENSSARLLFSRVFAGTYSVSNQVLWQQKGKEEFINCLFYKLLMSFTPGADGEPQPASISSFCFGPSARFGRVSTNFTGRLDALMGPCPPCWEGLTDKVLLV